MRVCEVVLQHFDKNRPKLGDAAALLNQYGRNGESPLTDVVSVGLLHIVRLYVTHGADIESEHPKYKHTLIFHAARCNHMHILEYLLEHAATTFNPKRFENFRDRRDSFQRTLLHWTAEKSGEMTALLLKYGYDPCSVDKFNSMPMHVAAWHGNLESIEILFKAWPAGCRQKGQRGMLPDSDEQYTPRQVAETLGRPEAVRLLMRLEEDHFDDLRELP
jgi:ankyrin repeat protein